MTKPLPLIEVQNVIHYAMPKIKAASTVGRHTVCGLSTMIPGRRVKHKHSTMNCKACKSVATQVWGHTLPKENNDV